MVGRLLWCSSDDVDGCSHTTTGQSLSAFLQMNFVQFCIILYKNMVWNVVCTGSKNDAYEQNTHA